MAAPVPAAIPVDQELEAWLEHVVDAPAMGRASNQFWKSCTRQCQRIVARSGATRFGLGYLGQLVSEYLGNAGVYAAPGDLDGLVAGIRALLTDSERRAALGAALRQRAIERYSWDRAGREIVDLYDDLGAVCRRARKRVA